jgi:hypothetical protein
MSAAEDSKGQPVKFIRVRGRVVPIRADGPGGSGAKTKGTKPAQRRDKGMEHFSKPSKAASSGGKVGLGFGVALLGVNNLAQKTGRPGFFKGKMSFKRSSLILAGSTAVGAAVGFLGNRKARHTRGEIYENQKQEGRK